jgi:cell wall-associated NlpC family hydrolase
LNSALLALGVVLILGGCAALPGAKSTPPGGAAAPPAAPLAAPAAAPPDRKSLMVESATAMLGQPYRFGGAAPGGFDCSGLVVYAAGAAGIRLPRTATEQLHAGVPVPRSELKSGDLVFMHLKHKELHVGIAIDGERFVHAPSSGGHVRIDSLAAPPYAAGFLRARRVIGGADEPAAD